MEKVQRNGRNKKVDNMSISSKMAWVREGYITDSGRNRMARKIIDIYSEKGILQRLEKGNLTHEEAELLAEILHISSLYDL
jgi:hypothetical protein